MSKKKIFVINIMFKLGGVKLGNNAMFKRGLSSVSGVAKNLGSASNVLAKGAVEAQKLVDKGMQNKNIAQLAQTDLGQKALGYVNKGIAGLNQGSQALNKGQTQANNLLLKAKKM